MCNKKDNYRNKNMHHNNYRKNGDSIPTEVDRNFKRKSERPTPRIFCVLCEMDDGSKRRPMRKKNYCTTSTINTKLVQFKCRRDSYAVYDNRSFLSKIDKHCNSPTNSSKLFVSTLLFIFYTHLDTQFVTRLFL